MSFAINSHTETAVNYIGQWEINGKDWYDATASCASVEKAQEILEKEIKYREEHLDKRTQEILPITGRRVIKQTITYDVSWVRGGIKP